MAAPPIKEKQLDVAEDPIHKIRITLTSRKVEALEKGNCDKLVIHVLLFMVYYYALPFSLRRIEEQSSEQEFEGIWTCTYAYKNSSYYHKEDTVRRRYKHVG